MFYKLNNTFISENVFRFIDSPSQSPAVCVVNHLSGILETDSEASRKVCLG